MARTKCRPRLAQLSPEPKQQVDVVQVTTNNHAPDKTEVSTPMMMDASNDAEDQAASHLLALGRSTQARVAEKSPEPEASVPDDTQQSANTNLVCPQCNSIFPNMGIQDFREHVESCTRPTTAFSDTTNDSLSPPPKSLLGDDELDNLTPYHLTAMDSYPESKPEGQSEETGDPGDVQQKILYPQTTDIAKFVESFEGMEDMDYATLYRRTANAQNALVEWQNEWMELDAFIRVREPAAAAKEQKNPRVPKGAMIGIGYQDQLESFAYGYEHNAHHKAVGMQDPLSQRLTNGSNGGRELRQRVPTQKAAEAEMSTSPESEDDIGGRRRMRRKVREEAAGMDVAGSRIFRIRNESRLNSESRDPTPPKTFASGRAVGRPRKNKATGAARLQELLPGSTKSDVSTGEDQRLGQTIATTESWGAAVDPNGTDSRPTTSTSTTTGISTDDPRYPPLRASTRTRKRQNTSDFEDALPSNKRIGRPIRKVKPAEETSPEMALSSERPMAQNQDSISQKVKGRGKTVATAKAVSKKVGAASQNKEGHKPSRASENMRRRWAAKKKAEALGLPVPKIGRYPKESADAVEQSNSPNPAVGRKRKRDDNDPPSAGVDAAEGEGAAVENPPPAKKRGGRQKKAAPGEPEKIPVPNTEEAGNDNATTSSLPVHDNVDGEAILPVASKKKVNKPKKNTVAESQQDTVKEKGVATSALEGSAEVEHAVTLSVSPDTDLPSVEENHGAVEDLMQAPQPRTSGRIRRQTSVALSSNRSSQKPTVTPTPGPTQQSVEEPKIKEEQPAVGPITTRKRGRQPNSASLETASKTPSVPRDTADEQGPPAKRRRAELAPRGSSYDNALLIAGSDEAESAHEQPVVKRRGGRPPKVITRETPGTDATSSSHGAPESSAVKKRGAKPKDPKTGDSSALVILPGVVMYGNQAVLAKEMVQPDMVAKAKGTKPAKKKADSTESSEEALDEEAIEKAKVEAAKLSKSAKMSAAMKARWENGSMKAVMAKKKAANEARRAQQALQGQSSKPQTPVAAASAPPKRRALAPLEEPVRTTKRRRNMGMDGAADTGSESDTSISMLPRRAATTGRKTSEYDRFQELVSPTSTPSRRQRRPAALRASQSISIFHDNNSDEENGHTEATSSSEDEETEIKKQFDSEYDHFQAALNSPSDEPVILTGKRKRKPVMNLEEAMRIEASEDDADFEDI